jgi:hypothetical protein
MEIGDGCTSRTGKGCKYVDKTTYSGFTSGVSVAQWNKDDLYVYYPDYHIEENIIWGSVNSKPELFENVNGMSSSDVVNSDYGYHSDSTATGGLGSNDPAVSANKYKLLEPGNSGYTESGYFEAHRTASQVADADGPNGSGNGFIAYHENKGVQGVTDGVFRSEVWNNNPDGFPDLNADYISENDLPDVSCPGETVRCLFPTDVSTKQTGWGTNPDQSFNVEVK